MIILTIGGSSSSEAAGFTPALTAAAITLGVGLVLAAGTQIVTHTLRMQQWRYERRFTVFGEYLTAITELVHRTSGLLDDAEESAVQDWTAYAKELNAAQERVTASYGQIRLVGSAATVRDARTFFIAVMQMFNMTATPVDGSRRLNSEESASYRTFMNDIYRPTQRQFLASARSDIRERGSLDDLPVI